MADDIERTNPAAAAGGAQDGGGFEQYLRAMMAAVSVTVRQPPGLAGQVVERGRRRRRRTVAAAVALAVAAVGVVVIPQVLPERDAATPPADISTLNPPRDSAYGVDVHWLPDGFGVGSRSGATRGSGPLVQYQVVTEYLRLPITQIYRSHGPWYSPERNPPVYTVGVTRGPGADDETWLRQAREAYSRTDQSPPARTTPVGEHPAYLTSLPSTAGAGGVLYSLSWSLDPTVRITVTGTSQPDVRRIAENLVVGPAPVDPPDRQQAPQVEQAARAAFATPGSDPRLALDQVEDGDDLRPAMDDALRASGESLRSLRVDERGTRPAVLLSGTEAMIKVVVDGRLPEGGVLVDSNIAVDVRLVLTAGGWKVKKQDYCVHMALMGVLNCPPLTIS